MSLAFQKKVRTFAREHLLGHESNFDAFPTPPLPVHAAFHDQGLANWWIAKQHGGLGVGLEDSVEAVVDLAYADAGVAFTLLAPVIGSSIIHLYGSPELRDRYLPKIVETGIFSATLGAEHEAGSELSLMTTSAERVGSNYVINGLKAFSTNAGFAHFLLCICAAPKEDRGYAAVIIPKDTPGIKIEKRWKVIGLRSSGTYEVSFSNCTVPATNALEHNGLKLLEVGLNPSRTLIAATAIGIGRRIRDLCLEYARKKPLKGSTLLASPIFAAKLGQMEMQLDVMLNACKVAGREYDKMFADPNGASEFLKVGSLKGPVVAKMLCGQFGWNIASVGSEMFGGLGFTEESLIGKLVRDVRYVSLIEGGDDVLREFLFKRHVVRSGETAEPR